MKLRILTLAMLAVSASAFATDYLETEGNDSKVGANVFTNLVSGDRIIGTSTGSSTTAPGVGSADYFKINTAALAQGIYRHRLTITTNGTAGHTGTLRGLTTSGAVTNVSAATIGAGTDVAVQTSSTTSTIARSNEWYGFGAAEEMYYRVTGGTATTAQYEATLTTEVITPVDLGTYQPGVINFSTYDLAKSPSGTTFSYTDTEITLYDSNFNSQINWNNDDYFPLTSPHNFSSRLSLNLAAGVYYFAVSQFNLANNLAPGFINENSGNDNVMDFGGSLVESSASITQGSPAVPISLDFSVQDSVMGAPNVFDAAKPGSYGVYWGKMTVVPEPGTMAALGLGAVALIRRRRSK